MLGGGWLAWLALAGQDRALLARVLRSPRPTAAELERAELVGHARRRAYWSMGLLTSLSAAILVVHRFPDPSAIGPPLAVALLALLFAALADLLVASPAISRVRQLRIAAGETSAPPRTPTAQRTRQPAGQ